MWGLLIVMLLAAAALGVAYVYLRREREPYPPRMVDYFVTEEYEKPANDKKPRAA